MREINKIIVTKNEENWNQQKGYKRNIYEKEFYMKINLKNHWKELSKI